MLTKYPLQTSHCGCSTSSSLPGVVLLHQAWSFAHRSAARLLERLDWGDAALFERALDRVATLAHPLNECV
jgi:hypothetical protein